MNGFEAVATRITNAETRFVEFAMERAGLTQAQAERALSVMRKGGKRAPVKIDPVNGSFHFSHGAFADADVLRRAATA